MYVGLHVKCPLFWPDINETFNFLKGNKQKIQTSNLMKIRPIEGQLFHADGRTDRET
jgi:hypothetical protein